MILNHKTAPKEQFLRGIIVICQPKGNMTAELMKYWLSVVWNRQLGALLRKWENGIGCTGSLSTSITAAVSSVYVDIVVIPKRITSQWQVLDVVLNEQFRDHLRHLFIEWHLGWTII